ncbi:MAG: ComF family protein [Gammaproteobacteria bacterium]
MQHRGCINGSFVPFIYASPIDDLIKELKFGSGLAAGRELGALMMARGSPRRMPQVLIPVPLHWRRLARRGYNQSQVIAEHLSKHCGLPLLGACRRSRFTLAQAQLNAHVRTRNVRGAFEVSGVVRGLHVAIVDDVITTGATMRELVRVLRRAGASRVEVWAAARAVGF